MTPWRSLTRRRCSPELCSVGDAVMRMDSDEAECENLGASFLLYHCPASCRCQFWMRFPFLAMQSGILQFAETPFRTAYRTFRLRLLFACCKCRQAPSDKLEGSHWQPKL